MRKRFLGTRRSQETVFLCSQEHEEVRKQYSSALRNRAVIGSTS
jgi:hypothetical protein